MSTDVAFSVLAPFHSFNVFAANGIQRGIKFDISTELVQCSFSACSVITQ